MTSDNILSEWVYLVYSQYFSAVKLLFEIQKHHDQDFIDIHSGRFIAGRIFKTENNNE